MKTVDEIKNTIIVLAAFKTEPEKKDFFRTFFFFWKMI